MLRGRPYMTSRSKGGGGQGFCVGSTNTPVIKSVTMMGGWSKVVQNCVMLFMDDP